mmetsp:Transcript_9853/g.13628  ORF Transcript_9853/g.13628 Transcript_9853/m.13628 type:complete len:137 (+) Transcript_9853:27-437(+)
MKIKNLGPTSSSNFNTIMHILQVADFHDWNLFSSFRYWIDLYPYLSAYSCNSCAMARLLAIHPESRHSKYLYPWEYWLDSMLLKAECPWRNAKALWNFERPVCDMPVDAVQKTAKLETVDKGRSVGPLLARHCSLS